MFVIPKFVVLSVPSRPNHEHQVSILSLHSASLPSCNNIGQPNIIRHYARFVSLTAVTV
jgi:hypothetical protein